MFKVREGVCFLLTLSALLLSACAHPHRVNVYIWEKSPAEGCDGYDIELDSKIDLLFVLPGDRITWTNTMTRNATLRVKPGVFNATSSDSDFVVTIKPGSRVSLKVVKSATGMTQTHLECDDGIITGPDIVVGEPPP